MTRTTHTGSGANSSRLLGDAKRSLTPVRKGGGRRSEDAYERSLKRAEKNAADAMRDLDFSDLDGIGDEDAEDRLKDQEALDAEAEAAAAQVAGSAAERGLKVSVAKNGAVTLRHTKESGGRPGTIAEWVHLPNRGDSGRFDVGPAQDLVEDRDAFLRSMTRQALEDWQGGGTDGRHAAFGEAAAERVAKDKGWL